MLLTVPKKRTPQYCGMLYQWSNKDVEHKRVTQQPMPLNTIVRNLLGFIFLTTRFLLVCLLVKLYVPPLSSYLRGTPYKH